MSPRARVRQRGAVSVLFALVLTTVLLGFLALVIDVGHFWQVRDQLQNAADAAALAGVRDLNGASSQFTVATASARTYAGANDANGTAVSVPAGDVTLGRWDFLLHTFTPMQSPPWSVNAVSVTTRRTQATGDAVGTYFAQVLGVDHADVTATAIAAGGGPSSTCGFIFALPSCSIIDALGNLNCNATLTFNSNNNNAAFTLLSLTVPTASTLECAVACALNYFPLVQLPTAGCTCQPNGCLSSTVQSQIKIGNGNILSTTLISYITWALTTAGPNGLYVQVPIFSFSACPGGNLSNTQTIIGYARVRITGATAAPSKSITVSVDCTGSTSSLPAQGFFGLKSTQVYLVK